MKRLLISFLSLLLLVGTATAMQEKKQDNNPEIIFDRKPTYRKYENLYYISARLNGDNEVGYVAYRLQEDSTVEMRYLGVLSNYRHMGIAHALFNLCINEARKAGGKYLVWDAMSLEGAIRLQDLISIYKKMVQKLSIPESKFTIGKIYGPKDCKKAPMALKLT